MPNHAVLDFEIRSLAGEDVAALITRLEAEAEAITAPLRVEFPEAAIRVERLWDYPGLGTPTDAEVVKFVKGLTGANGTIKVAFGTEGGLFDQRLGVPTVICGPGSMAQGHKPDEFVSVEQVERCPQNARGAGRAAGGGDLSSGVGWVIHPPYRARPCSFSASDAPIR